ncbi:MAG TPA: DUF5667 domain-containing protein [Pseudonocardia sp.]
MPEQGDPIRGAEERFAEAVELGQPSARPVDADLARDLEIAEMFRALAPSLSAGADAKARVRARVMAGLAADGPPADGGGSEQEARGSEVRAQGARPAGARTQEAREGAPDSTPTEQLPVIPPAEDAPTTAWPAVPDRSTAAEPATAVLTEPDVAAALRPGRRRRHALPSRPSGRPNPGVASVRRRIMAVGAAALLGVIAIAGGGIFASRDSVPGDPLYAMKRAAEDAGGIFASGNASRAERNLDLAATRLDEIQEMVHESADPELITSALKDFDDATTAGSRLALSGDDSDYTYAQLATWTTRESARLSALRSALPASTQAAADDSARLLERVHRRASALAARSSCSQVTSGAVDDLGPLPATGACVTRQASQGGATAADPNARRASATSNAQQPGARSAAPQPGGSADPAQESGSDGTSPNDESGSATTTTAATPTSDNVDVPLPLPVPIHVPPLLPGKSGITLG